MMKGSSTSSSPVLTLSRLLQNLLVLLSVYVITVVHAGSSSSTPTPGVVYFFPSNEYHALWELYNVTNGPYWKWNSTKLMNPGIPWDFTSSSTPNNPCVNNWEGITCQYNDLLALSVLTELTLPAHNMTGVLPSSIVNFPNMTVLTLSGNNLRGTLPSTISKLHNLVVLNIQLNHLNGSLPSSLGELPRLSIVNASANQFSGSLPSTIYSLPHLTSLELQENRLHGTISPAIAQWTDLQFFRIDNNSFMGSIPDSICTLTSLVNVQVNDNFLNGSIPENISQLSHLRTLRLDFNYFTGSLPTHIGNLTNLYELTFAFNFITGSFPSSMARLSRLQVLVARHNLLQGSLADIWRNMTELQSFDIATNLWYGSIPSSFQYLRKLQQLELTGNAFSSGLLNIFANKTLTIATLSDNQFDDNLSNTLQVFGPDYTEFSALLGLGLESNYFYGTLGTFLQNSIHLRLLDAGYNFFSSTLPGYFTTFKRLNYFHVHNNMFTGKIPSFGALTPFLVVLSVEYNFLTGSVPHALGYVTSLTEFSMDSNRLSGSLPSSLVNCTKLQVLTAKDNKLSGPLLSFGQHGAQSKLINLDLCENYLSGTIPTSLFTIPTLQTLLLSNNCLFGTLSVEMCQSTSLVSVSLNGLSTATQCQRAIFPGIPDFTAFASKHPIDGSIPACVFTIPSLMSLYLSGNGLRGTLPSDVVIATSLQEMSLSYNLLGGSIPTNFATHPWTSLDLSYNEISGTLLDTFFTFPVNTSLSLQVNRLSGNIPEVLLNSEHINVLEGNIFTCNFDKSQLPRHDPNKDSYACGTDAIDRSIYVWMACTVLVAVVILRMIRFYFLRFTQSLSSAQHSWTELWTQLHIAYQQANAYMDPTSPIYTIHYHHLQLLFNSIRELFVWITLFAVVILLPLYAGLTSLDSIYTHTYAWEVSAILLSGVSSSIMLPLALSAVIIFIFVYFRFKVLPLVQSIDVILQEIYPTLIPANLPHKLSVDSNDTKAALEGSHRARSSVVEYQPMVTKTTSPLEVLTCVLLGSFNVVLMVLVDIAYVIAVLQFSSNDILGVQIMLSAFKIFWNELFLWKTYPVVKKAVVNFFHEYFFPAASSNPQNTSKSLAGRDTSLSTYGSTIVSATSHQEEEEDADQQQQQQGDREGEPATTTSSVSRLSSFLRPSSNNALLRSSNVHNGDTRASYFTRASMSALMEEVNQKVVSRFQLKFLVYTGILNNVVIPTLAIAVVSPNCFHDAFFANSPSETLDIHTCDFVLAPGKDTVCVGQETSLVTATYNIPFIYRYQCSSAFAINFTAVYIYMFIGVGFVVPLLKVMMSYLYYTAQDDSTLKRVAGAIMPRLFKELSSTPIKTTAKIFHRDKLVVRYSTYLAVLLSFGIPFPPLAIIILIATLMTCYFEQFTLGKLLYEAHKAGYHWYATLVEKEMEGMASLWYDVLWIVLPFPSFIYGFLIFDTMGNVFGTKVALVPFVLVICLGYILLFMRHCWVASNQVLQSSSSRMASSRHFKNYLEEAARNNPNPDPDSSRDISGSDNNPNTSVKSVGRSTLFSKLPFFNSNSTQEVASAAGSPVTSTRKTTVDNPILSYGDDNL